MTAEGLGRKPYEQIVADIGRHFRSLDRMLEGLSRDAAIPYLNVQ